jgi:hypothetical protein
MNNAELIIRMPVSIDLKLLHSMRSNYHVLDMA